MLKSELLSCVCVCCYLTQLSYPGDGGLPRVLSIHGVLFEKQEDLVVFGVVALRDQVYADEPGVYGEIQKKEAGFVTSYTSTERRHVMNLSTRKPNPEHTK